MIKPDEIISEIPYLDEFLKHHRKDIADKFDALSGVTPRGICNYPSIVIRELEGRAIGQYQLGLISLSKTLYFKEFCNTLCHEIFHSREPSGTDGYLTYNYGKENYWDYYNCGPEILARAYGEACGKPMGQYIIELYSSYPGVREKKKKYADKRAARRKAVDDFNHENRKVIDVNTRVLEGFLMDANNERNNTNIWS